MIVVEIHQNKIIYLSKSRDSNKLFAELSLKLQN